MFAAGARGRPAGGGRMGAAGAGAAAADSPAAGGLPPEFVSASPAMAEVWRTVDRVAATDVPELVRGESGVGKDVVARTLHARSPRAGRPFLKINCAALPASLLESELFGYQRGAFTGARNHTKGKSELAHGGTPFIDEIGEMPTEIRRSCCRRSRSASPSASAARSPGRSTRARSSPPTAT